MVQVVEKVGTILQDYISQSLKVTTELALVFERSCQVYIVYNGTNTSNFMFSLCIWTKQSYHIQNKWLWKLSQYGSMLEEWARHILHFYVSDHTAVSKSHQQVIAMCKSCDGAGHMLCEFDEIHVKTLSCMHVWIQSQM